MKNSFLTLIASHENNKFKIEQDLPEVGWYVYKFDVEGNCIYDYLQDTKEMAIDFCLEEFNVPADAWAVEHT